MAKRKKPAYLKILEGMNACYGTSDRDCSRCPYDKYNDRDYFGMGTSYCMEKLNEDANSFLGNGSLQNFCFCKECCCYRPEKDPATWQDANHGHCATWDCDVIENEYCARGAQKECQ